MNKWINTIKNNLLESYIIINILYILIGSILCTLKIYSIRTYSSKLTYLLIINIIVGIRIGIKRYSFHKVDILLLLINLFGIISTIFAYNSDISLIGCYDRNEGFYTINYYLTLFYLCTYVKNKKIIIYTILLTGIIQLFYGCCQNFHLFGVKETIFLGQKWIRGFTTNPNFYGCYILICMCYTIGLYIENKKLITSFLLLLLSCSFMVGLLLSNSLACLIALIGSLLILLVYCIYQKKVIKYILLILSIILVFLGVNKIGGTTLLKDFIKTKEETKAITKGKIKDEYGSDRVYLWKETIKQVPRYIWHGVGIDNFGYILDGKPISKDYKSIRFVYDKAHKEYLQILVTEELFALITYLIFHFIILINGFKISFKNKEIYLLLPVIAYLIQSLFSISVIEVAPIFYVGMGLILSRDKKTNIYIKYIKRILDTILSIIFLILLFPYNILIALLIKVIDKNTIIKKQVKIGREEKEFILYSYNTKKNNKYTKLGKILNKNKLDRIPQFINIIKGDMSIVGPSPLSKKEYNKLKDKEEIISTIKPGIIVPKNIKNYRKNRSFYIDLKIVLNSLKSIFEKYKSNIDEK